MSDQISRYIKFNPISKSLCPKKKIILKNAPRNIVECKKVQKHDNLKNTFFQVEDDVQLNREKQI